MAKQVLLLWQSKYYFFGRGSCYGCAKVAQNKRKDSASERKKPSSPRLFAGKPYGELQPPTDSHRPLQTVPRNL